MVRLSICFQYSDRGLFFDRWQHALYPNFIIMSIGLFLLHRLKSCYGPPSSLMLFASFCHWMGVTTIVDDGVKRSFDWHSLLLDYDEMYVLFQTSTNAVKLMQWKWTTAIRMPLVLILRAHTAVPVNLNTLGMVQTAKVLLVSTMPLN